MKFDVDTFKDLLINGILSGGITMSAGIGESMTKASTVLTPSTMKVKVVGVLQLRNGM